MSTLVQHEDTSSNEVWIIAEKYWSHNAPIYYMPIHIIISCSVICWIGGVRGRDKGRREEEKKRERGEGVIVM